VPRLLDYIGQGCNLGWAIPDNVIVIDIDPRNGGKLETITKYGIEPNVITGGKGYHFYIQIPSHIPPVEIKSQWAGIDIKKKGGYVLTAGSITQGKYELKDLHLQPCPDKLLKKLLKRKTTSPNGKELNSTITKKTLARLLSKLPIDNYDTNDKWFPILAASYNATKGEGLDEFLDWSISDPKYSHDSDKIIARWNSLKKEDNVITIRTLLKEVNKYSPTSIEDKSTAKKDFDDKVKAKKRIDDIAYTVAINVLKNHFNEGKHLKHGNDLRYWYYNGRYWETLQINMIEQHLYNETVRLKLLKPSMRKGITQVFKTAESILRALCAIDKGIHNNNQKSVINCRNGELWIDENKGTVELRPHNPESYLTYMIDCEYRPKKKCPKFDKALEEIFVNQSPRLTKHLWEMIGYTIQPKKNIASWVLFHGKGSNGKTVILNVLSALLGDSVIEKSICDLDTSKNNHALADLPGKLAVIDEDVAANLTLPDSLIKKISENKMLTANPKNAQPFRFQSIAIPILASNSWPKTLDLSEGLRRRALVFPFKRRFEPTEQNINLANEIVNEELSGVLNRAIDGLQRLRKRNRWKPSIECDIAKRSWFASNNQVSQFIDECLNENRKSYVVFAAIWKKYVQWSYDNGIRMHLAKFRLREELNAAGYEITYKGKRLVLMGYELA
jgi:putative DNA primase/helicase